MIGGIIGDIVGSIYEFRNIKTKDFELFVEGCKYTDDSVLTIATADWLLHGGQSATYYADWGNAYPYAGYGGMFSEWLDASIKREPKSSNCLSIWLRNIISKGHNKSKAEVVPPPYNSCGFQSHKYWCQFCDF